MSIVFDTEPLLTFYKGETESLIVKELLNQIIDGSLKAHINIVNLIEVYCILHRYSPEAAEEKTRKLRAYGINVVPVDDNSIWRIAAQTKSKHPMRADAYVVATEKVTNSKLVIGKDPELQGMDIGLIRV